MTKDSELVDLEERIGRLDPQEQYNLQALLKRMQGAKVTAEAVGKTLPEAVLIGEADSQLLSKSMVSITERSITSSVEENPEALSTALFPIIGAAIRKALEKFMSEIVETMNQGLEKTFSFKRILWRIEAIKTGVPYMDIVLRETLRFRVEHVFLIHKKTALLIQEASSPGVDAPDADMVASMLTVIRDYVKDSMALDKSEELNSIKAGEYSIIIEDGPRASIALFIRGSADALVRKAAVETLEQVHLRYGKALRSFKGDTKNFQGAEALLARCLISQDNRPAGKKPVHAIVLLSVLALGLAVLLGFGIANSIERRAFIERLDREPGFVVVSAKNTWGKNRLKLLHDPRARTLAMLAGEQNYDVAKWNVEIRPYVSPIFGDSEIPEELAEIARQLASIVLLFQPNSDELEVGQEPYFERAGELVAELTAKAVDYGLSFKVDIVGHAAGREQSDEALRVSSIRAEKAYNFFLTINQDVADYVQPVGVGTAEPVVREERTEEDKLRNRSVTFKVVLE